MNSSVFFTIMALSIPAITCYTFQVDDIDEKLERLLSMYEDDRRKMEEQQQQIIVAAATAAGQAVAAGQQFVASSPGNS